MMLPVVVIAGRPNVGKSTLFNRLAGRRAALVADTPGVTRDRKEAEAMLRGRRVRLVDTAGLEEAAAGNAGRAHARAAAAPRWRRPIWCCSCVDARAGLTPADGHFAQWLRRQDRPRAAGGQQGGGPRRRQRRCWTPTRSGWASRWRCRPSTARASPT